MSLVNSWVFQHTVIDGEALLKATRNQYRVVSVRPYADKKGVLPDGYNLTLLVLADDYDYGVDKQGNQRENNQYQTFDITVLNRDHEVKKGDFIKLIGFDAEHSFVVGFDMILRFSDFEIINNNTKKVQINA